MALSPPLTTKLPRTTFQTGRHESPPVHYKSMAEALQRSTTPEMAGRSSFSSIRETDSDLVQTFTLSKISSYAHLPADAVVDDESGSVHDDDDAPDDHHDDHEYQDVSAEKGKMVEAIEFCPPRTHPHSRLHGAWFPAAGFKGWKQIDVKGKLASRSFGDLQVLNLGWTTLKPEPVRPEPGVAPGDAPMERLPVELLSSIINLLVLDIPPNGVARRNVDLMSLLLTSKTLHTAALTALYSQVTIPHSRIFKKFLEHVKTHPSLGTIVRRLDFSHFNPVFLFASQSERKGTVNLTSDTLLQCLELTPNLQEFLAQEHVQEDLDARILLKLFTGLPRLRALDFCGCSSKEIQAAFTAITPETLPSQLSIKRLSLHKCMTLPSSLFETLLPRLPNLTYLDVAGTRITDEALASIPHTAKITHLNLAKCTHLTARGVIKFLATHPAVINTLTFLSLATDARSHELLEAADVADLLPILPRTLKSLSLKGSKMDRTHIERLLPLTKCLEELAVGRCLTIQDIERLFVPDESQDIEIQLQWKPHTLKYIDLSDMLSGDFDLSALYGSTAILTRHSLPLDVIEVSDDVFRRLAKSQGTLQRIGWRTSELGSRSWVVRNPVQGVTPHDDGVRPWKMGAESWGMRKVPVARAEVGGMYGSYMFARKL